MNADIVVVATVRERDHRLRFAFVFVALETRRRAIIVALTRFAGVRICKAWEEADTEPPLLPVNLDAHVAAWALGFPRRSIVISAFALAA